MISFIQLVRFVPGKDVYLAEAVSSETLRKAPAEMRRKQTKLTASLAVNERPSPRKHVTGRGRFLLKQTHCGLTITRKLLTTFFRETELINATIAVNGTKGEKKLDPVMIEAITGNSIFQTGATNHKMVWRASFQLNSQLSCFLAQQLLSPVYYLCSH